MFSPICFTNFFHEFSQFEQLEKKTNFFFGPKQFFFLSLPVEKEIIKMFVKKFVDSEFQIGEAI